MGNTGKGEIPERLGVASTRLGCPQSSHLLEEVYSVRMESRQVPHPQLSTEPSYVGCAHSAYIQNVDVLTLLRLPDFGVYHRVLLFWFSLLCLNFGIELFVPFTLGSYSKF